jgi:predicted TIM-barrel fold metal-dependent hydrolase
VTRRQFAALAAAARIQRPRILDTHIHLFDPTRTEGVPWPEKNNPVLYRPSLPARFRQISEGYGVFGAIAIEASPWPKDNLWLLQTAASDARIAGVVGNLDPGAPDFARDLERLHANPLFLGIRFGNLWGRDIGVELAKTAFIGGLKRLAAAGLVLDTANPRAELMEAMVRVTDAVPELRVVLDHMPQLELDARSRPAVRELGRRPQVFAKLSAIFRVIDGKVPREMSAYRARLDELMDTFGSGRVLFGSDWPNSDRMRPYADVVGVAQEYFATRTAAERENYFFNNSRRAYRWKERG